MLAAEVGGQQCAPPLLACFSSLALENEVFVTHAHTHTRRVDESSGDESDLEAVRADEGALITLATP